MKILKIFGLVFFAIIFLMLFLYSYVQAQEVESTKLELVEAKSYLDNAIKIIGDKNQYCDSIIGLKSDTILMLRSQLKNNSLTSLELLEENQNINNK